jgi:hypothetical protein
MKSNIDLDREILTLSRRKNLHPAPGRIAEFLNQRQALAAFTHARELLLRGISVAKYIVGQERRLVDPPSQVVAGVRTVTTKMNGRCDPHVAVPIRFFQAPQLQNFYPKSPFVI